MFLIILYRDVLFHSFFFFNDTATTEIYTLSLHDALPISRILAQNLVHVRIWLPSKRAPYRFDGSQIDRKSTRLNSSHANISYAVFCLKKKKKLKFYLYSIIMS